MHIRSIFRVVIVVLSVSILTPDHLFAQNRCMDLFAVAPLRLNQTAKGVDFVWLMYAPTSEQDRRFRERISKGERPQNPMAGGLRGRGVAEEAITFAHENIRPFLQSILAQHLNAFAPDEQTLLRAILEVARTNPKIEFVSERQHPEFFKIKQGDTIVAHRLAKTDFQPGSTIYLNADQVQAYRNFDGEVIRFDQKDLGRFSNREYIAQMFGILVHELGHHTGIRDDADRPLDVLAVKAARIFEQSSTILNLESESLGYLGLLKTNLQTPSRTAETGRIGFFLPEHLFDLTDLAREQLEKTFGRGVSGLWLQGVRWEPVGAWDMVEQAQPFVAAGDLIFRTDDGALYQVPTRWLVMVSHPDKLDNAYQRRRNWTGSIGFISHSNFERHVGLQILKDQVKPLTAPPLFVPTEVGEVRAAESIQAGEPWTGEIALHFPEGAKLVEAKVIATSDELAFGSYFEPLRFQTQHSHFDANAGKDLQLYFMHQFPANTVRRKLVIDKISLRFADGHSEDILLPKRQSVQINGPQSKAQFRGMGFGPTAQPIRADATIITVKDPMQRIKITAPPDMPISFYVDVEGMAGARRAELLARIQYRASDGLVKNVNAVLNLLDPRHPWLKAAHQETLPNNGRRFHFTMTLPKEFGSRPVEVLTLQQVHVIDQNLAEVVEPIQYLILPKGR